METVLYVILLLVLNRLTTQWIYFQISKLNFYIKLGKTNIKLIVNIHEEYSINTKKIVV